MKPPPLKPPSIRPAGAAAKPAGVWYTANRRSGAGIWVLRLIMLLICAGSVLLLNWSLFVRLLPVTREHQSRITEMSRLSDDVEQLRLKWDPTAVELTRSRFRAAQQSLFRGPEELDQWKDALERNAASRALEARLQLGEPQESTTAPHPFSMVKAELEIWPLAVLGLTNSPYQRVLGYFQDVVNSPKRVDLSELLIQGNSNSVQQARAVLHVLAGDLDAANNQGAQP